jgi:hypothetical protein
VDWERRRKHPRGQAADNQDRPRVRPSRLYPLLIDSYVHPSALEEVKGDLSVYTNASTFKRIILYVDLGSKIKACTVKLDFAMQLFQVMYLPLP